MFYVSFSFTFIIVSYLLPFIFSDSGGFDFSDFSFLFSPFSSCLLPSFFFFLFCCHFFSGMSANTPESIHRSLVDLLSPFPQTLFKLAFSYAKSTFSKSKHCCHIQFLKSCLRLKFIPKGMLLHHTPSNHSNNLLRQKTDMILKKSSMQLIKVHIADSDRQVTI